MMEEPFLQLRENDLGNCLDELSKRWFETFQRKGVRLEANIDPSIPTFRFDCQKVQQVAANLLDNALKHTPSGGTVVLRAAPHFWERCVATMAPMQERRRFRLPRPNSVEVSVTGALEHDQKILDDYDALTSEFLIARMESPSRAQTSEESRAIGLTVAKRLVLAHHGKIWVEPSPTESRYVFLLPMDHARYKGGDPPPSTLKDD
jgi:nitrogen-specific signal transduction histidine kinase